MIESANQQSDAQLVRRVLGGERMAFDALVERHMGMVFAIAWGRLGDREWAEDLVQEVFLRAFLALDRLSDPELFAPWLGRIARNLAINWLRRDSRIARLTPLVDMDAIGDVVDTKVKGGREEMETQERAGAVHRAIAELPPNEREAILLHFAEGLSASEIARRLGVHQSTISRRIQIALRQMRGVLTPMFREAAPMLRPAPGVTVKTLGVIAAAAAMSATSKAALAAKSTQDVVALTQGSLGLAASLQAACAALITGLTIGGKAMATGKGIAALIGAAAVIGGAVLVSQGEGDVGTTPASTSAITIAATLPDGRRIEVPTYGDDVRTEINADVDPAGAFLELNRMGLMGVLPREFDLTIEAEGLTPDHIGVFEIDTPVNALVIQIDPNLPSQDLQSLPTVEVDIRGVPGRAGVCEVNFAQPLDRELLLIVCTEPPGQGVAVLTDGSENLETLLARLGTRVANPQSPPQAPSTPSSSVGRVRSNLRSLATALEGYNIDWGSYPPAISVGDPRHLSPRDPLMSQMPSPPAFLTTPIAYILPASMHDPHAATPDGIYAYDRLPENTSWFNVFGAWAVLSPGPDGDWDLQSLAVRRPGHINVPLEQIWSGIYDATNGAISSGDIVRGQRYP